MGQGIPKLQEGMGEYTIMPNDILLLQEITVLTKPQDREAKERKDWHLLVASMRNSAMTKAT